MKYIHSNTMLIDTYFKVMITTGLAIKIPTYSFQLYQLKFAETDVD